MTAVDDLDEVVEQYHLALGAIVKGDPEPLKMMYSHGEEVTLANPFGPPVRGWEQAAATVERAASNYRDGEIVGFETVAKHVTPELAYIMEVERFKAKIGGRDDITPFALRVTSIFRPEEGTWKCVHRHADPITSARPAVSVLQE
jgi:ketosteroid isomerase-like protein